MKVKLFILLLIILIFYPIKSFGDDFSIKSDKISHFMYGSVIFNSVFCEIKKHDFIKRVVISESVVLFIAVGKELKDEKFSIADIIYTLAGGIASISIGEAEVWVEPYNHGEGGILNIKWRY